MKVVAGGRHRGYQIGEVGHQRTLDRCADHRPSQPAPHATTDDAGATHASCVHGRQTRSHPTRPPDWPATAMCTWRTSAIAHTFGHRRRMSLLPLAAIWAMADARATEVVVVARSSGTAAAARRGRCHSLASQGPHRRRSCLG
jgi:hypothetical protein